MLQSLHVRHFALIDDLTLDFSDTGFHCFTGETGAGKSLMVDALSLLLGARAQKEWVRHGEKEALVEASFNVADMPELRAQCEALGYSTEDDALLVRRVLNQDGRSKVFMGGRLSSLSDLQKITSQLVAICGQNMQYELAAPDAALDALDRYAKLEGTRNKLGERFTAYRALVTERDALVASEAQRLQRLDYVAFQLQELAEAAPIAGEEHTLRLDRNRLAFAEKLRGSLSGALAVLSGDDDNALQRVANARKQVRDALKLDASLEPTSVRLDALHVELDDLGRTIEHYVESLASDPQALDRLEARLALLGRLAKKHGCAVDALAERTEALTLERDTLSRADEQRAALDQQVAEAGEALLMLGAELTRARKKAAAKFSAEVTRALRPLALPKAEFCVRVESADSLAGAHAKGFDRVGFELSTNVGEPQRPLAKVASGGELSRVSLALQSVLGDRSDVPTFIFDEVDAGIGGAVAEVVGQTLQTLGGGRQVLCVTHAPQIAALAGRHFQVEKHTAGGRTISDVVELTGKTRSGELARMLGGVQITDTVRKHAAELLRGPSRASA